MCNDEPEPMTEPIIGSVKREEAKLMGMIPNRGKRSEVAFFLRMALTDYDVTMYDPDEGILLANRFISYLEVLAALETVPAKIQAVMIGYYKSGSSQEQVAEKYHMSVRTLKRWLAEGLDQMAISIWK